MVESIKEFLDKSSKDLMSIIITDINTIVLIKRVFEVDSTTNPPIVIEKDSEVASILSLNVIDRAIVEYTENINYLNLFRQKVVNIIESSV